MDRIPCVLVVSRSGSGKSSGADPDPVLKLGRIRILVKDTAKNLPIKLNF